MDELQAERTVDQTDLSGSADEAAVNLLSATGSVDAHRSVTVLRLADGRTARIPTSMLLETLAEASSEIATPGLQESFVLPIVEEQLEVGKRTIATGTVRLEKQITEYSETLDEPLAVRTFDIERIVLNHPVETAPAVRHEGATTIYPVVEEQLVLTKQLILREEVRVTQRDTESRDTRTVTLQREHLVVTRTPAPAAPKQTGNQD